jgi:hypothetical protein
MAGKPASIKADSQQVFGQGAGRKTPRRAGLARSRLYHGGQTLPF